MFDYSRKSAWQVACPSDRMMIAVAEKKNSHAMALGRLGGLKGGRARAEKLSARRRREIARQAAAARWHSARKAKTRY
jgi:hypothetical protein